MKHLVAIILVLFSVLIARVGRAEVSEVVLQTIAMESADQPFEGQVAVAQVILNRAHRSGKSLEAVCLAPKQFSAWNDRKWASRWLGSHYTPKARKTALMALERAITRPRSTMTHYHTKDIRPYWAKGHTPSLVIGEHVFYEGIR